MRFFHTIILSALTAALVAGCNRSGDGTTAGSSGDKPTASISSQPAGAPHAQSSGAASGAAAGPQKIAQIPAGETDTPAKAVTVFLEAVRKGNDERAAAMFTPAAREKTNSLGIEVAPKGSDTARYEVGGTQLLAADGARVGSRWTDVDASGAERSDEITWMLRREPDGWRVAGMATVVFEGEPPLLLDFENPEETMKKLQTLQDEINRRAQAPAATVGQTTQAGAAALNPPPSGDSRSIPSTEQAKQPETVTR